MKNSLGLVTKYRLDEVALLDSNFPVRYASRTRYRTGNSRFRRQISLDLSGLYGSALPHERGRGAAAGRERCYAISASALNPLRETVLKLMNKRHQRVNEMYETARKANLAGIRVTFNLIFGYPGETEADRSITFRTMADIANQFPNVRFSPNIFTPYPGIPIWPQLRQMGLPSLGRSKNGSTCPWVQIPCRGSEAKNWRGSNAWLNTFC